MSSITKILLDGEELKPSDLWSASQTALDPSMKLKISIAPKAKERIQKASDFVQQIKEAKKPVYGINTGFGNFAEVAIEESKLDLLQKNLIFSHSCGVGEPLSRDIVLCMWLIRLNTICRGNSGVRPSTVDFIVRTLESGLLAEIPSRGSVGASGDLAPSAHATLALLGEGNCTFLKDKNFSSMPSREALKTLSLEPLKLGPKEGLSLINGTQLTTALALKAWAEGSKLLHTANMAAALSIEGLRASRSIVNDGVLTSRRHPGTLVCGNEIKKWLSEKTGISESHLNCGRVQDAYSLRCAPQVHGAIYDELTRAEEIIGREINSSTDNPLLFPEEKLSVSGGNFHAIYTARVSDNLASAFTTLASISERRIALAMNLETSGLPHFLVRDGGLNSGFMMAQVTAAALVSESKTLSFPASVDSIPTNADREDHVSMGPGAGHKVQQICKNLQGVLAVETLVAVQAIDLLAPLKSSRSIEAVRHKLREKVAFLENDRILAGDIKSAEDLIHEGSLISLLGES